ncbi:hypothetical protein COLO4_09296 [Corchorus olitorius]|uniref:Uncharacterized protein n=1 Tax=Corchorus olitorius TaxID=93759 RepID=A0A1R3KCH3_9ROSI|nr:hypothetical protein COLO4_09296 [Corchorus olitorius]
MAIIVVVGNALEVYRQMLHSRRIYKILFHCHRMFHYCRMLHCRRMFHCRKNLCRNPQI